MKTSYLEYYKLILDKVSFDSEIWEKEYKKALSILTAEEAFVLKNWAYNKYFKSKRNLGIKSERRHNGISLKSLKSSKAV
ncbi:hypothetical protein KZP23_13050 [Echinicola marina]|uniref:hypothetical protein n=1 Tax=Echinicola marina TaxID=2859768 RepID=UPI001CF70627|nr:hypothetical protein [Echinicola marina]UCS95948.1 hypothetical protein KZP23_13050 [Echinicola marina]